MGHYIEYMSVQADSELRTLSLTLSVNLQKKWHATYQDTQSSQCDNGSSNMFNKVSSKEWCFIQYVIIFTCRMKLT
jgi:hypothetical protein